MNLGAPEILVILLLAFLLFGAKKLPELGKGLGQGIREFRKTSREFRDDLDGSFKDDHQARPARSEAREPAETIRVEPREPSSTPERQA